MSSSRRASPADSGWWRVPPRPARLRAPPPPRARCHEFGQGQNLLQIDLMGRELATQISRQLVAGQPVHRPRLDAEPIASSRRRRRVSSISGRRFIPQVPPSTNWTPSHSQPCCSRESTARPTPSSPMRGSPGRGPGWSPDQLSWVSTVSTNFSRFHEPPAGDDGRDHPCVFEIIRPDREIDVDWDERQVKPGHDMVHEPDYRRSSQQDCDQLKPSRRRPSDGTAIQVKPVTMTIVIR